MNYLLDTNVVFEWAKPRPDPGAAAWLAEADEDRLFISVVTLAELRHGVQRLAEGARRARLDAWLARELPLRFEGRVLPIDEAVANHWGRLVARAQAAGQPAAAMDAWLAATAKVHAAMLVTRNVGDFEAFGVAIFDPGVRQARL